MAIYNEFLLSVFLNVSMWVCIFYSYDTGGLKNRGVTFLASREEGDLTPGYLKPSQSYASASDNAFLSQLFNAVITVFQHTTASRRVRQGYFMLLSIKCRKRLHTLWKDLEGTSIARSNETPTWCNTVQALFLQSHSTCFGRQVPIIRSIKKIGTATTGTGVIVAGRSSHHHIWWCDDLVLKNLQGGHWYRCYSCK